MIELRQDESLRLSTATKKRNRIILAVLISELLYRVAFVVASPWYSAVERIVLRIPGATIDRVSNGIWLTNCTQAGMIVTTFIVIGGFLLFERVIKIPNGLSALGCLFAFNIYRMISDCIVGGVGFYKVLSYCINAAVIVFALNFSKKEETNYTVFWRKTICLIGIICALWSIVQAFVLYSGAVDNYVYRQYRISGYIMDATSTATIMAIAMVCCISLYREKTTYSRGNHFNTVGLAACLAALLLGGILTGARAFLYYLIVVLLYIVKKARWYYKGLIVILGILGIIAVFSYVSNSGIDVLQIDRSEKWSDAIKLFADHPIFGIGANQYAIWKYNGACATNIHNVVLQTAAEGGIVGLVFLFIWWTSCFKCCFQDASSKTDAFKYVFFLMVIFSFLEGTLGKEYLFSLWVVITRAITFQNNPVRRNAAELDLGQHRTKAG